MITASLISGQSPQMVQIVIDGIPAGVEWSITGEVGSALPGLSPGSSLAPSAVLAPAETVFTPGGFGWRVPGGSGVSTGGQIVLTDNRSPGNSPYLYTLTTSNGVETSNTVVVPFRNDIVLQTLDGQAAVDVQLLAGSLGLGWEPSVSLYRVPGRARPVARYDVLSDNSASLVVKVPMGATPDFRRVIASGAPILYRFGDDSFDLEPAGIIQVTSVSSEAVPTAGLRFWTLGYTVVDDPFVDVPLGAFSWDRFDESRSGLSWSAGFDQAFRGLDWDAFDRVDWSVF